MPEPKFVGNSFVRYACLLIAAVAWPGASMAETDNPLTLRATYSSQNDSNLFHQPNASAEQISMSSLGLGFQTQQSLQSFYLNLNLVDNKYQNFSYLNYTATNYDAAWQFAVTSQLHGKLSSSWQETLNNYEDVKSVSTRYLNVNKSTRLDATYEIDGSWNALVGWSQNLQNNQRDQVQGSDFTSVASNIGLAYVFGSGSKVSFTTLQSAGEYLNQPATAATFFDDSFQQTDNELRLHWVLSGSSVTDLYVTSRSVSHPHVAARNFSGTVGGASVNWAATGKTSFSAAWSRELSTYQTIDANYSQADRITLGADWQVLAKLGLSLRHDVAHTTYLAGPLPFLQSQRQDDQTNTSLALTWTPRTQCTVSASVQNSARTSNTPGLDFTGALTSLTATLNF